VGFGGWMLGLCTSVLDRKRMTTLQKKTAGSGVGRVQGCRRRRRKGGKRRGLGQRGAVTRHFCNTLANVLFDEGEEEVEDGGAGG